MPATPSGFTAYDATTLVFDGWNHFRGLADSWLLQTNAAIADLDTIHVEPLALSVEYNVDEFLPSFVRPTKPDDLVVTPISVDTPDLPVLAEITTRDIGDAPVEPDMTPFTSIALPDAPTDPLPTAPSDIYPTLDVVEVPVRPDYVLPTVPTLYELALPDVPVVVIPEFDGVRPTFDIATPEDGALEYTEVFYTSDLLDDIKSSLRSMLQGGLGLPLAVEQAIFDRGRAREDRLSRKQLMEVDEDMGARGLVEPNGILAKRLREVRADNREKAAGLNRDLTVRTAEIAVENLRTAIAQGIALEQTLIQQTMAINDRALKVAMFAREYGLNRLNALIAYANLQQQAYATDAQVWRQRIEGALAALEVYKGELEGQQLVGQLNSQLVQQYEAGIRAVVSQADLYKADVDAARVKSELNVQRIEAGKLKVQVYSEEVDAWSKRWDGYRSQVEGALGYARFGEVLANVFATNMQGYKTKGEAYFNESRFQLEKNGQTLDLFRSNLQRSQFDLQGQVATLDGALRAFAARAQMYEAEGGIAQAESAAYDRAASLKAEIERNRTAVAVQSAQMQLDQMLKIGELLVEQVKMKAQALSQLLASSQAGVNLGASISGSGNFSKTASIGWSGETPDFAGIAPGMVF